MSALNPTGHDPSAVGNPTPLPVPNTAIAPVVGETPAQTVRNVIDSVRSSHNKFLAEVEPLCPTGRPDDKLTPSGWDDVHARFASAAVPYLDRADQILAEREAEAERNYAETLAAQSPKLDVGGELRADRALRRAESAVRNAQDGQIAATVKRVIAEADNETRGVLLTELPDMLAQRQLPTAIVTEAAEQVIPELGHAARQVIKARQTKALLGAEVKREREAQARHGKPYVQHASPAVVSKYDPDA